jgi:hypothetical protein
MDIAARHEEVTGAALDEAHRRSEVLGSDADKARRQSARDSGRAINIDEEIDAVAHWGRHIVVACRLIVLRLREVAAGAARCLGSVQLPLALLDAGNSFAHFLPHGLQTSVCISSEHIKACVI